MKAELYETLALEFLEKGTKDETLFTGLASETGEIMSERVKELRTGMSSSEEIVDELGDVLWYVTMLANRMGSSLEEVMKSSIEKLEDRALNGKKGK
jgi:NTP pyrophosphatase (non-canonical NTP hydrolase)